MKVDRTTRAESVHLAFEGRIDSAWAESASQELEAAIRSGRSRIELDFDRVTFISSVGIGILVQAFTRFRAVGGTLAIVSASAAVRGMLRVAKLESMLAPTLAEQPSTSSAQGFGEGWSGTLRTVGSTQATVRLLPVGAVEATARTVAIGHFALAGSEAEAAGHFGEGLAAGGTVVVQPASAPRPDCLASSEQDAVSFIARDALVVEGLPMWQGRFEADGTGVVSVSSLAEALVKRAEGPIAFVALGECAGAFGAWARISPDEWAGSPDSMSDDAMRNALRFAGEPMHGGESLVVAGVACGDHRRLSAEVEATLVDVGAVRLHAHAAVASYRPVPAATAEVRAAGTLLAEQPLRVVMHAMRSREGLETAFVRGVCFAWGLGTEPHA